MWDPATGYAGDTIRDEVTYMPGVYVDFELPAPDELIDLEEPLPRNSTLELRPLRDNYVTRNRTGDHTGDSTPVQNNDQERYFRLRDFIEQQIDPQEIITYYHLAARGIVHAVNQRRQWRDPDAEFSRGRAAKKLLPRFMRGELQQTDSELTPGNGGELVFTPAQLSRYQRFQADHPNATVPDLLEYVQRQRQEVAQMNAAVDEIEAIVTENTTRPDSIMLQSGIVLQNVNGRYIYTDHQTGETYFVSDKDLESPRSS